MKDLPVIRPVLSVLGERAFWVALLGFAATFYLYAQGQLDIEAVLFALNALATAVGVTIGVRDAASKLESIGVVKTNLSGIWHSRKFWISALGIFGAVALFLTGQIDVQQLAGTVAWLLGTYLGLDALEAAALSYRSR